MLSENGTVIIDLYGQNQRRLRNVGQEFAPLAADDEAEAEPSSTPPEPKPAPIRPMVATIGHFRCPLPPTRSGRA